MNGKAPLIVLGQAGLPLFDVRQFCEEVFHAAWAALSLGRVEECCPCC